MLITFPNTPVSTDGHFAVETSLDLNLRDIGGIKNNVLSSTVGTYLLSLWKRIHLFWQFFLCLASFDLLHVIGNLPI